MIWEIVLDVAQHAMSYYQNSKRVGKLTSLHRCNNTSKQYAKLNVNSTEYLFLSVFWLLIWSSWAASHTSWWVCPSCIRRGICALALTFSVWVRPGFLLKLTNPQALSFGRDSSLFRFPLWVRCFQTWPSSVLAGGSESAYLRSWALSRPGLGSGMKLIRCFHIDRKIRYFICNCTNFWHSSTDFHLQKLTRMRMFSI